MIARCSDLNEDLTAWIEGQLPERRGEQIRRHLVACASCRGEAESLRDAIAWQGKTLRAVVVERSVDAVALKERLRHKLLAEAAERPALWTLRDAFGSLWGRLALAGAAVSLGGVALVLAGGPGMVLMPLGLESPPPAVVQRTDLFKDYPLIERLDVLEHLDTVESVPLDDDSVPQRG